MSDPGTKRESPASKRVLVAWGTKLGGTEGIARTIAESLEAQGHEVDLAPASEVRDLDGYEAAIIGGALYANRWHHHARRLVLRNVATLRRIPVWLFSSGPLDDSADEREIAPVTQVAALMDRIGALGHVTFGGRLTPDATGFAAAAMAKTNSGDWRNPERIRAWATEVARALPEARPGVAIEPPARSLVRLAAHAAIAWAASAVVLLTLWALLSPGVAVLLRAFIAPVIFVLVGRHYFRPRGAREPLPAALAMGGMFLALEAIVTAGLVLGSFAIFAGVAGVWLPAVLIVPAVWLTGVVMSTLPWPKLPDEAARKSGRAADAHDAHHKAV